MFGANNGGKTKKKTSQAIPQTSINTLGSMEFTDASWLPRPTRSPADTGGSIVRRRLVHIDVVPRKKTLHHLCVAMLTRHEEWGASI